MNITIISDASDKLPGGCAFTLAKQLSNEDIKIRVLLPYYHNLYKNSSAKFRDNGSFVLSTPDSNLKITILSKIKDGIEYFYISAKELFEKESYTKKELARESAIYSVACLETLRNKNMIPDIILSEGNFCAPVSIYLKLYYKSDDKFCDVRSFHYANEKEEGIYPCEFASEIFAIEKEDIHIVLCNNEINLTKGALICADRIFIGENSPSILYDTKTSIHHTAVQFGFKIRKLCLGIDYDLYNAQSDKVIEANYTSDNTLQRIKNKTALQKRYNFSENEGVPTIIIFTEQKNATIGKVLPDLLKCDVNILILSPIAKNIYDKFATEQNKQKIAYDTDISINNIKKIFSGSEFALFFDFLYACGNPAYIACAYGCIPIVPMLKYFDISISYFNKITKEGNGFSYDASLPKDIMYTIWDALAIYRHDPKNYYKLLSNTMKKSFPSENGAAIVKNEAKKLIRKALV